MITLKDNWEFRDVSGEEWLPARVPGCVHTDLMASDKIEDPFFRLNEHGLQWIDKTDWEYRTVFEVPAEFLSRDRQEICFRGLDTYADVYLNGELILEADNMFREWSHDVSGRLRKGENSLRIYFHSPTLRGLEKMEAMDYRLPAPPNDLSEIGGMGDKKVAVFTRKAGYHFGWDWGPRLVTSGIWKDIELRAWDRARIENMQVRQEKLDREEALVQVRLEIRSLDERQVNILGRVNGEAILPAHPIILQKGINLVEERFSIEDPELWWPNGLGEQVLYEVSFELSDERNLLSESSARIGLRTLELVREPDTGDMPGSGEVKGTGFYFRVNGEPVFMKGANYIPQDAFLDRVGPDRYEQVIRGAAEANMNMLRVWGGGIYEKDIFYDLCDKYGILVWQDFMFACAMYPGDSLFLESVRHEAMDNVKRLRNHPCIALWCGNNENLSAWYNWGWKNRIEAGQGPEVADIIWKAYEDKFHGILPEVVGEYDPDRFYWSSSPSASQGVPENWKEGDVHYWGVWWGKEPFETYRTRKCRFMSEYGFQSFPEINTVRKYALESDYDIYSEVMKSHQRSSIGNETIEYYLLQDYEMPEEFPMFLYVGQILQAEGTRIAMEGHRKNMPHCMGSLFWQIDDCWPVASWSSVDYYGNWKAQQYFAKKAFKDILISPQIDGDSVSVFLVSDRREAVEGTMHLRLMDFKGVTREETREDILLKPNSSGVYFSQKIARWLTDTADRGRILLDCRFLVDGQVYSTGILYFDRVKNLELPEPGLEWSVGESGDSFLLSLSTRRLAKNVRISVDGKDAGYSDNYFDLLPGEQAAISIRVRSPFNEKAPEPISLEEIREKIRVISLVEAYR